MKIESKHLPIIISIPIIIFVVLLLVDMYTWNNALNNADKKLN